jgi:hypothetical protein
LNVERECQGLRIEAGQPSKAQLQRMNTVKPVFCRIIFHDIEERPDQGQLMHDELVKSRESLETGTAA